MAPPDGPTQEKAVADIRDRQADMEALVAAGRYNRAFTLAAPLLARAEAVQYPPVLAEVQYAVGHLQAHRGKFPESEQLLTDAAFLAIAHNHDDIIKRAQVRLVHLVGYELARLEDGLQWSRHGRAAVTGLGAADDVRADLENATGAVHGRNDAWPAAESHFRAALAARQRAFGDNHLSLAPIHANLAVALARQDRYDEAIEHGQRSLILRERTLGLDHPDVALALTNLASAESGAFRLEDARAHITRAIALMEANMDKDHPTIATAYNNLGNVKGHAPAGGRHRPVPLDEIDSEVTDHFTGAARRHPASDIDIPAHGFVSATDVEGAIHEAPDMKVLPLRMEAEIVARLDEARERLGLKTRMDLFRKSLADYLTAAGEHEVAQLFTEQA